MITNLNKIGLGTSRSSLKKLSRNVYRVFLNARTRNILQRLLFDMVYDDTWLTTRMSVIMRIHPIVDELHTYTSRVELQRRLSKLNTYIAKPFAYAVVNGLFIVFVEDVSPSSRPLPPTPSPVVFAGLERLMLSLWSRGFSLSSVSSNTFLVNPKTYAPIIYDLTSIIKPSWPRWRVKEYTQAMKGITDLEEIYSTSSNTDAIFMTTIRKRIHKTRGNIDLKKARQYVT